MISRKILQNLRFKEIEELLRMDHTLANAGIAYGLLNRTKAHPLHRICDGVFENHYSQEDAIQLAKLFVSYGSQVDGIDIASQEDSPLVAAASLKADQVALYYLELGANIHHQGCMGGTALHWASWTGQDRIVEALITQQPILNQRCTEHKATPIFWAVHGHINSDHQGQQDHLKCARLLLEAGADPSIPNGAGTTIKTLLIDHEGEMQDLFKSEDI